MSKEKLLKNLCRELDELGEKRELSMSDLEKAEKMSTAAKNLMKMEMMEEEGYSGAGEWEARGDYGRASYPRRGSYERDGSYDGRDYSGRQHYVRGHYSRDPYQAEAEMDPRNRMQSFQNDMRW